MNDGSISVPNGICDNCGALRLGAWCHACGQHADTAHHSVKRLAVEAVEHLANTDGKVFRTLKNLCFNPGKLTTAYLMGHRVPQVAPLQLFFVTLVVFLFVAEKNVVIQFATPTAQQIAEMPRWVRWTVPFSASIQAHGGDFVGLMRQSSEIFGLLTVPLAALLLWGLFAGRSWKLYDHLIFSLHSLSFQAIMVAVIFLLDDLSGWGNLLMLAMPMHLFVHMRGTYRSNIAVTLLRMALLFTGTLIAYSALSIAWIAAAYFELTM